MIKLKDNAENQVMKALQSNDLRENEFGIEIGSVVVS